MSDVISQLRAADPLRSLTTAPIDFDAMKSRVTAHAAGALPASRRRQMKVLSIATVAVLVTTVTLVGVTNDRAVTRSPRLGVQAKPRVSGAPIVKGFTAAGTILGGAAKNTGNTYAPAYVRTTYVAGDRLSASATSGSAYRLHAFNDATSEAQHLATIFGVKGTITPVSTTAFAAEYQAGDMGSSTGSMQYFVHSNGDPDAGFTSFQYIANGAELWTFNGAPSTVNPATAARDLSNVRTVWRALNTGFTLINPRWVVQQLSPQSNAVSKSETQVSFILSVDGFQTLQAVQFSFDDTGKMVRAEGFDLSIIGSVTFPFQTVAATIDLLNAEKYGDCSSSFTLGGVTNTLTPTIAPITGAPAATETLTGVSILYQPEMMSNGEPWLMPFYEFTTGDGALSSAPSISALGPAYFSVHEGAGSSCTMTLTQP